MGEIPQGLLVACIGPGKSTLLKMIGSSILPNLATRESGNGLGSDLFVPSHLRVLHCSAEAQLFYGSLYKNLTLGVLQGDDNDGRMDRVLTICRRVGLQEGIVSLITEQGQDDI